MAVKIIFSDLDGTLLNSDKHISEANLRALHTAAEHGVLVVPATGRFYNGMPEEVRTLPFLRYAVTVNGAEVYDRETDTVLYRAEIDLPTAERVYDVLETLPVIYDCYMDGWGYMERRLYERLDEFIPDPRMSAAARAARTPVEDFRAFLREKNRSLQKIQMFFLDAGERERDWRVLAGMFPELNVTSSVGHNVEINAKGADKGAALRFLCGHLGIPAREAMAFGDGSNDRGMLEAAGVGISMGNAAPVLREAADFVTDTNDRDGVAKAIARAFPEWNLGVTY